MGLKIIKKGTHHANHKSIGIWWNKKFLYKEVIFNPDCKYFIDGEDMLDTNKLFGIGFLSLSSNPHWIDSARFGWRWDLLTKKIVLSSFCHVDRKMIITDLVDVDINELVRLSIQIISKKYVFTINDKIVDTVNFTHNKKISFPLDFYFGGNRVAPHDMTVIIN